METAKHGNDLGEPVGDPVELTTGSIVREGTAEHLKQML